MIKSIVESAIKLSLALTPSRFQWIPHNMIGHPLMEICEQVGCKNTAEWVHQVTLPPMNSRECK